MYYKIILVLLPRNVMYFVTVLPHAMDLGYSIQNFLEYNFQLLTGLQSRNTIANRKKTKFKETFRIHR